MSFQTLLRFYSLLFFVIFCSLLSFSFFLKFSSLASAQEAEEYYIITDRAQKLYAKQEFQSSYQYYKAAERIKGLSALNYRLIRFHLADSLWRASIKKDPELAHRAVKRLSLLVLKIEKYGKDALYPEIKESIGDYLWLQKNAQWQRAWQAYSQALLWWLDEELHPDRKKRFFNIVNKIANPPWAPETAGYGDFGNLISEEILDRALTLATTAEERSQLLYYLARYRAQNSFLAEDTPKTEKIFKELIATKNRYTDAALFYYAQWLERVASDKTNRNRVIPLYQRLSREFSHSQFSARAKQSLELLTKPVIQLQSVEASPLEDLKLDFLLSNTTTITLSLERLALERSFDLTSSDSLKNNWFGSNLPWYRFVSLEKPIVFKQAISNSERTISFGRKIPAGVYLAKTAQTQSLLRVSNIVPVLYWKEKKAKVFVFDQNSGFPVSEATVKLCEKLNYGLDGKIFSYSSKTDIYGYAEFQVQSAPPLNLSIEELANRSKMTQLLVTVSAAGDENFTSDIYSLVGTPKNWRILTFTNFDRYCPGEDINWKLHAYRGETKTYDRIVLELESPGNKIQNQGEMIPNDFGNLSGRIHLSKKSEEGDYTLKFFYRHAISGDLSELAKRTVSVSKSCE
jgi:hypothetical protein